MPVARSPPDETKVMSQALRAIRRKRGLRAAQVAEAMGLPLRTYEHFEAGRAKLNLERLDAFADATQSDPYAVMAAVMIGSPQFAARSSDNKLMMVLMLALRRLDERLGDDISRLEVGRLVAAFRRTFTDLETDLAERDAAITKWLADNTKPSSDPDDDE